MTQRHPIQNDRLMLVTVVTKDRMPFFSNPVFAHEAIETLYRIQDFYPVFLYAFVFMPDHCHLLLRVPEYGSVSKIINVYKRAVTFNIGGGIIWQRRFHIRLTNNIYAAKKYTHENPVRAGFCSSADEFPWSSACGRWDVHDLPLVL